MSQSDEMTLAAAVKTREKKYGAQPSVRNMRKLNAAERAYRQAKGEVEQIPTKITSGKCPVCQWPIGKNADIPRISEIRDYSMSEKESRCVLYIVGGMFHSGEFKTEEQLLDHINNINCHWISRIYRTPESEHENIRRKIRHAQYASKCVKFFWHHDDN